MIVLREKILQVLTTKQQEHESVHAYYTRFKGNVQGLELVGGGNILCFEKLMDRECRSYYVKDDGKAKVGEKEKQGIRPRRVE